MKITKWHIVKTLVPFLLLYLLYILVIWKLEYYVIKMPVRGYDFKNDVAARRAMPQDFDTLILGDSSTALSVVPHYLGNSVNLSGWGTSSMDNYHMLLRYMENHKNPSCILLSTTYNHQMHYREKLWTNYIFLNFYSLKELQVIYDETLKVNGYPANEMSKVEFLFKGLLTKLKLLNYDNIDFFFYAESIIKNQPLKFKISLPHLKANKGFVESNLSTATPIADFLGDDHSYYLQPFEAFPTEDLYIEKIVDYAKKINSKVIFLPPPLVVIPNYFNPAPYLESLKNHISPLILKHPGNKYLELIPNTRADFYSITHMNTPGAIKFSKKIGEQISSDCLKN